MTTPTAWLALTAAIVFVVGAVFFSARTMGRVRIIGLTATLVMTVALGWIAWYVGITPAGA